MTLGISATRQLVIPGALGIEDSHSRANWSVLVPPLRLLIRHQKSAPINQYIGPKSGSIVLTMQVLVREIQRHGLCPQNDERESRELLCLASGVMLYTKVPYNVLGALFGVACNLLVTVCSKNARVC